MNHRSAKAIAGFTIIELMVAMLLGLIVIAGITSVFLANQQVYRTNSALGDVQDSTRMSFEMLAQNIREAGLLGCGNNGQVANVLEDGPNNSGTDWWANWGNSLMGYGSGTAANPALTVGTAAGNQVAGTDSLMILSAADIGLSVNTQTTSTTTFTLNGSSSDLVAGAIMIVCDPWQATIFRANSYTPGAGTTNPSITYGQTFGGNTVNCSTGLGYQTVCTAGGNAYTYAANSPIATLEANVWYIGTNPAGTTSLYLVNVNTATNAQNPPQEMVRGVTAMNITYNMTNATGFVTASNVTSWTTVDAVQVKLTVEQISGPNAGTNGTATTTPLTRTYTVTSTVRNRVQ
jgi:type IV pilus assembly protein PilW